MIKEKNEKGRKFICVICKLSSTGYGNNPYPICDSGSCCDLCDERIVIPSRIKNLIALKVKKTNAWLDLQLWSK